MNLYQFKLGFIYMMVVLVAMPLIVVKAAQPPGVTSAPYTVEYSARLTDASGNPINSSQDVRFSIWSDSDVDSGDFLASGAINIASAGYSNWEETHSVTPDANGLFHVQLGSINTLPNFSYPTHVFLQVDVKPSGTPLTSFETLDPDGNIGNLDDRHPINSVAFAINSDTVDGADVGTGPGNLPQLDVNSLLSVATIPNGTNQDLFIIDSDNSAPGSISLQFGGALAKTLEWDSVNSYFLFNDSVHVNGGLSADGNVDFSVASEFHIKEVADEATTACTTLSEMVLDTTEHQIYVCTAVGNPGTWAQVGSSATPQNMSLVFVPEYDDSVIFKDGSDNRGKLEFNYADTDGAPGNANFNFYEWTTRHVGSQDIDLVIRTKLPDGFNAWQATPITFDYKTFDNNVGNNSLDVSLEDSLGAPVVLNGASGLVSSAWNSANITFGAGAPTFNAGSLITIHIKLNANNVGSALAGNLTLHYVGT